MQTTNIKDAVTELAIVGLKAVISCNTADKRKAFIDAIMDSVLLAPSSELLIFKTKNNNLAVERDIGKFYDILSKEGLLNAPAKSKEEAEAKAEAAIKNFIEARSDEVGFWKGIWNFVKAVVAAVLTYDSERNQREVISQVAQELNKQINDTRQLITDLETARELLILYLEDRQCSKFVELLKYNPTKIKLLPIVRNIQLDNDSKPFKDCSDKFLKVLEDLSASYFVDPRPLFAPGIAQPEIEEVNLWYLNQLIGQSKGKLERLQQNANSVPIKLESGSGQPNILPAEQHVQNRSRSFIDTEEQRSQISSGSPTELGQ